MLKAASDGLCVEGVAERTESGNEARVKGSIMLLKGVEQKEKPQARVCKFFEGRENAIDRRWARANTARVTREDWWAVAIRQAATGGRQPSLVLLMATNNHRKPVGGEPEKAQDRARRSEEIRRNQP